MVECVHGDTQLARVSDVSAGAGKDRSDSARSHEELGDGSNYESSGEEETRRYAY